MSYTRGALRCLLASFVLVGAFGCGGDGPECVGDEDCFDGVCVDGACMLETCMDGLENGDESDVDCGGSCAACPVGSRCLTFSDCESGVCAEGVCTVIPECSDGMLNGDETDVDCGGGCDPCANGSMCLAGSDCVSDTCVGRVCADPDCSDGEMNGDESDVDCGGSCDACEDGASCGLADSNCTSGVCEDGRCAPAACDDGVANGDETDVDCGGSCAPCSDGELCVMAADCSSAVCDGTRCAVPACDDGVINGDETDEDCGGSCDPCADGDACGIADDCASGLCVGDVCLMAGCGNGVQDGDETDEDCGGSCGGCDDGEMCIAPGDCTSGVCGGDDRCAVAACDDGVTNGDESDEDCGGSCPLGCARGLACGVDGDCATDGCRGDVCVIGPTAGFDASPTTGTPPLMVTVASTAIAGDAPITSVEYDFGSGFAVLTSHSFASEGTYAILQRVTDANGFVDMAMRSVVVTPAPTGCFLSRTDKSPDGDLDVTADGLAVEMWTIAPVGIRSDCSIASGDGVFYFEGSIAPYDCDPAEASPACVVTPYELMNIGVATSSVAFSSYPGENDQGFSLDTGGAYWYDGVFLGSFDRFSTDTYGFVVDYRGANPIVHLITDNYGSPDVTHTQTLTGVTTDLHAMLTGGRRKVGVDAQFNFGNDTTNRPFRFDPDGVLRANGLGTTADALVLGFGSTGSLPSNGVPTLSVSSDVSIALGSPVTVTGTASDTEDGDLTASIVWEDLATVYGSRTSGSGGSFTFTPTQIGNHPIRATVFDSNGGRRQAVVMVTVTGTLTQYDPVQLVSSSAVDPNVGAGITLSGDALSARWTVADKMGLRANQGNLDDFWYFEVTRLGGPVNQGAGLVLWEGDLNPYAADDVPPSYSINTSGGAWQNIIFHASYDTTNTTYGFAVDYRGLNPTVYLIVGGSVVDEWVMYDVFVPVHPMLYGNFTGEAVPFDERINFGASAFAQDPCSALTTYGLPGGDVSTLGLGWGDANATSTCP